ncbi:hypothetical protein GQ53DRAFT_731911 [Thozetella sp. PMI_491]|nr:hypothetical protein GQ53DRAFT_731911 [Thozetella sp. PMI_491]
MPPINPLNSLYPLDLPAQGALYVNNDPSFRLGVQDTDNTKLRLNRERLRSWLATNIPIQFNKVAVSVDEEEGARDVTVCFADGTSATGDIVVGADGVNSIVRKHVLSRIGKPDPLRTLPIGIIGGGLTLQGKDLEEQLSLAHSGYIVTAFSGDGTVLFVAVNSVSVEPVSASYYWFLSFPNPAAATQMLRSNTATNREAMFQLALEKTENLHPTFRAIIQKTGQNGISLPALRFSECEMESIPRGRTTLLGDAAHCMTPFRGEGGVHGLMDAMNLGTAISRIESESPTESGLHQILGEFQDEMSRRGVAAIHKSRENFQSPGGNGRPTIWNQEMAPLPPAKVSLDSIPRSLCGKPTL